jgi:raffinose/stachyose/melibiose transport system permease protein
MSISTAKIPSQSPSRNSRLRFQRKVIPWLFILPILLVNLLVVIGPSIAAVYYSMTDWKGLGAAEFVGLENYIELFHDPNYGNAFLHNLMWLGFFLTVPILLALTVASFLAPIRKGGMLFRGGLFVAYIIPSVITANIWSNLMHPVQGVGAQLAKAGITGLDIAWLGRTDTSLLSVAFVDNWHWWGFLMVLFLTAMQSVPPELYDAAKIDGANRWTEFRYVTVPGIRPTLVFMLLMTGIWSFLAFDYVYILTQGGPAGSSDLLSVIVYKYAFTRFQAGYASAIGLTMSLLAGVIIGIFILLRKRGWEI